MGKNVTFKGTTYSNVETVRVGSSDFYSEKPIPEAQTFTPTASGATITPSANYNCLSQVTVNPIPSSWVQPSGNKIITMNESNIDVKTYSTVTVSVPVGDTIKNQAKTVTLTGSTQTITPDSTYTGLSQVTVPGVTSSVVSGIDSNFTAANIKSGVKILGIDGTYTGSSSGTSGNNQAKTATLTTSQHDVTPDSGYTGLSKVTIPAVTSSVVSSLDSDFTASNIKSGVNILGLTGTYTGSGSSSGGIDTSDATATASDIASGKTAYVNGVKISGAIPEVIAWSRHTPTTDAGITFEDGYMSFYNQTPSDVLLRQNAVVHLKKPASYFGDATAADVRSGKKFTSASGTSLTGTATIGGSSVNFWTGSQTFSSGASTLTFNPGFVPNGFVIRGATSTTTYTMFTITYEKSAASPFTVFYRANSTYTVSGSFSTGTSSPFATNGLAVSGTTVTITLTGSYCFRGTYTIVAW